MKRLFIGLFAMVCSLGIILPMQTNVALAATESVDMQQMYVTNLNAQATGISSVKVTWNATKGADGYIIYRKIGNGKFEYRYMVSGTSFNDSTAKTGEFNFYRVYAYKTVNGKRVLGPSKDYKYAKPVPNSVTSLKAQVTGTSSVKLTWNASKDADGYIIYRKVDNGKFEYRYMVSGTSYTDVTAKPGVYNYYRVYAYKNVNGNRILGSAGNYVYSKPIPNAVTNLKVSRNSYKGLTISWTGVSNVDGYIIYSQAEDESSFSYLGMTSKNSYNHNNINDSNIHFYRVYAYKKVDGKNVLSKSTNYVYNRAHDEPNLKGAVSDLSDYNCTYVKVYVKNNGNKPVTFYSENAELSDDLYYDYDRNLYLATGPQGTKINSITINSGEEKYLYYRVIGSATRYNIYSSIYLTFSYDGVKHIGQLSKYYGYLYI